MLSRDRLKSALKVMSFSQCYSYLPGSSNGPVPPPKPSLNGGLYGGAPFTPGAPWANVPVTPDVDVYIHQNLRSANPPPGATTQYPGNIRPGNNWQGMPGVAAYDPSLGNMQVNVPDDGVKGVTCSYDGKYAVWGISRP